MALTEKDSATETTTTNTSTSQVNSVTSDITLQTLQTQMELMTQMMETLKTMQTSQPVTKKKSKRNPNQSKYCWTHGLCSHSGVDCRTPAEGHIAEATLEDRRNGSVKNIKNA